MALPQDACEGGNVMSFGKVSQPVVTTAGAPFVSGVAATGRSVIAATGQATVFARPIAAWEPSFGATMYEVQLSRSGYPWKTLQTLTTVNTSMILPLTKFDVGTWYYRVRGIDASLPVGAQRGSWSAPIRVQITGNRVAIVG